MLNPTWTPMYAFLMMQSLAQLEANRMKEEEQAKRDKIESFMNSTKMNASKLYKEQCDKNMQQMNNKKEVLGKQKELKAKYTIVKKCDKG